MWSWTKSLFKLGYLSETETKDKLEECRSQIEILRNKIEFRKEQRKQLAIACVLMSQKERRTTRGILLIRRLKAFQDDLIILEKVCSTNIDIEIGLERKLSVEEIEGHLHLTDSVTKDFEHVQQRLDEIVFKLDEQTDNFKIYTETLSQNPVEFTDEEFMSILENEYPEVFQEVEPEIFKKFKFPKVPDNYPKLEEEKVDRDQEEEEEEEEEEPLQRQKEEEKEKERPVMEELDSELSKGKIQMQSEENQIMNTGRKINNLGMLIN